tara:strand:- start:188 stop:1105 length:918 start_codon:yes stop_codon:yes gene_type:complete
MPLPLIPIVLGAANLVRMVAPKVAQTLIKRGVAKKASQSVVKKAGKNIPKATKTQAEKLVKPPVQMSKTAREAADKFKKGYKQKNPKNKYSSTENKKIAQKAIKSKSKLSAKNTTPPKTPTKLTKTQKGALGVASVAIPTYLATRGKDAKNVREGFDKILDKGQKKPIEPIKKKSTKLDPKAISKADATTADEVGAKKMKPISKTVSPKPDYNERLGPREEGKTITTKKKTAAEKYGPFSEEAGKEWFKKNLGIDVKYEYPEDPDSVEAMKKGGRIKKNMKKKKAKTKAKKRIALRGYGAALRGF